MAANARIFRPILAGATLGDRLAACAGAALAISLTGILCRLALEGSGLPYLAGPIGASVLLVFAVPASPLAQPWPVIGGNAISVCCGIASSALIGEPVVAGGVAVGLAILVMSLTRSLHPPGAAMALTAVVGGAQVQSAGALFAVTVLANSLLVVGLAFLFHRLTRHTYPHVPQAAAPLAQPAPIMADIDAALADMHESFDIGREDLKRLLERAEAHAHRRLAKPK
jgi:CBS domain-containing membrane protein